MQCRTILKGGHQVNQCLVKWSGLPLNESTWEDTSSIHRKFPSLNLEDKVPLQGDGNVTNHAEHLAGNRHSTRPIHPPKYLEHFVVPKTAKSVRERTRTEDKAKDKNKG